MERSIPIVFSFNGGYATDLPTQARDLQYFLKAENIIYEVSGAVRKLGGATPLTTNGATSLPDIVGMYDYHRAGTAGTFIQKFMFVTSDGKVYKEDADGIMDDITGSAIISANTHPVFCQARDTVTIWFSTNNTPLKWSQSGNVSALGGTPPAGRGAVFHVNRLWVWGTQANPSRITFGSSTTIEDFTGADTGTFDIDPDDGDIIIGCASYKGTLIIWKGPNKGSIHLIAGTAISNFSRTKMVEGIALQSPHGHVAVGDDILFMSDRGIHSLSATQAYGSFAVADLTRFLRGHFRQNVRKDLLSKAWAIDYADKSCVLFTYAGVGSENDATLGLSYIRFSEEGWKPFTWTRGGLSAAIRIEPTSKARELIYGGTDGFAYKQDTSGRTLPSNTAYTMRLQTPELLLGKQDGAGTPRGDQPFNIQRMYLRSVATGNWNVNVAVTRDGSMTEQYAFNQGAAGFILGTSILNVGSLGGTRMQIDYADHPIGEARSVQFDITQGGSAEDANIIELGLEITPASQSNVAT